MFRPLAAIIAFSLPLAAQESVKQYTGAELIAAVKAAKPKGDIQIRASLQQQGKPRLQIQIKHHTAANGDRMQLHQVLFPKDRKGEGLLLRITDAGFTGWSFKPGGQPVALKPEDRMMGLFGTDLLVEDVLGDFLNWSSHTLVRNEKLGPVNCSVVESNSPSGAAGVVKTVRSWIDDKRLVPQKVELLDGGGKLLRQITTQRVHRSSTGYYVPTEFVIASSTGTETKVTGSGVRDDLTFSDADFTEAALAAGVGGQD